MTDDTFESRGIGSVYAGPAGKIVNKSGTVRVGEAGIAPSYAIRITNGVAYLAKASDKKFSGIACPAESSHGLDTAFTYSATASLCDKIEYFAAGSGEEVWAWLLAQSPATALSEETILCLSATDGFLDAWTYTDGNDLTDSNIIQVGHLRDYDAGSTSARLRRIVLNI